METYRIAEKGPVEVLVMKAKITKRTLQSLVPKEKPYEVVDTDTVGFILRVQPSGLMDYYVSYRRPQALPVQVGSISTTGLCSFRFGAKS